MKTQIGLITLLALSACNGSGSPVSNVNALATPTATPTPSVTPSPSPTPYAYNGGTGTAGDPYIVSVADDVQHIADHPAATFSIDRDISLNSYPFQMLPAFSGTLYGNSHQLINLSIVNNSDTTTAAMFTSLSGTVTGITFTNAVMTSQGYAAIVVGDMTSTGRISFCTINGGTVTSTLGGNGFSSGVGRPAYVTKVSGSALVTNTQDVYFNGTHLTGTVN